jgi:hypothetical protein
MACNAAASLSPSSRDEGVLEAEIDYFNTGGQATPTPTTPQPAPTFITRRFFPEQVRVAVVMPNDPRHIVAEQVTSSGAATFRLPAGRYWVLLPRENQPYLSDQRGFLFRYLPDKTAVFAWQEVIVPSGGTAQTALTITQQGT